jgi:hypothetical protein
MLQFFFNMSMLGFEAQQAIWLRTMKMSLGGLPAEREARLMVGEKISAAQNASMKLMTGSSLDTVVKDYRRKVRSNVRRLSKIGR